MKHRHAILASALVIALSACSQQPADTTPAADAATTEAPVDTAPVTDTAAVDAAAPPDAAVAATDPAAPATPDTTPAATGAEGNKPATVANCATTIESNDMMQYNVDAITVPSSCGTFTINLKHVGKLPVAAMGHNVVISTASDMPGIARDGMTVSPEHIKAGDSRVIAASKMIGGGESTSVSFDVSKIKSGGPFKFFCSFPGHLALMQGNIAVQ
jgi:azurin